MANVITLKSGIATPTGGMVKSELAIKHVSASHATAASSMLYIGEDKDNDGVTIRALGTGMTGDSGQGGAEIGKTMTFSGGTDITTSVSGSTVTITSSAGGGSGDITAVVAGTGLSGGATSGSATLTVGSAQTSIETLYSTDLKIGRASGTEVIEFDEDNKIQFKANGARINFDGSSFTPHASLTLGTSSEQWDALYVEGTAHIDAINYNGTDITATAAEINLLANGNARGTTALASGDGFLHNDNGTMRHTNISKLADRLAGSGISASDGVLSTDAAQTQITTIGALAQTLLPSADNTYDLGSSGTQWRNGWFDGTLEADNITCGGEDIIQQGHFTPTGPASGFAAGTNAGVGYTATRGLYLQGQGSSTDISICNDTGAQVLSVPTGTQNIETNGRIRCPTLRLTDYNGQATIVNAGEDTDKFLVLDSSNNVDFRTGSQVKSDIGASGEANEDTNLSATANGTSLTIESSTGTNVALPAATTSAWGIMSDDQATKLSNIETSADVTDTSNVTSSGALMDSECTNLAAVKAFTGEAAATADQTAAEIKTLLLTTANSVDSDQYVDGSIDTAHIADNQITLAKMAGLDRGHIIYGDSSGNPASLANSTTDGHVLTVSNSSGDIGWEAAAGGGGGTPTDITVADESSDTTCFPLFVTAATGDLGPKTGSNLTFDSANGNLVVGGTFVAGSTISDSVAQVMSGFGMDQGAAVHGLAQSSYGSGVFLLSYAGGPSDERLKTDISTIEYGLNEIKAITPKWFKYNESAFNSSGLTLPIATDNEHKDAYYNEQRTGFMAADVKTVMPKLVSKMEDDKDYETYDKDALIFVLVNAVKELEARVATLEG